MKLSSGAQTVGDGKNKNGMERGEKEREAYETKGEEREGKYTTKTHTSVIFHTRVAKAAMTRSPPNLAQLWI